MTESIETLPDYAAAAAELLGGEAVLGVRVETRAQLEALAERGDVTLDAARSLAKKYGMDVALSLVGYGHPSSALREDFGKAGWAEAGSTFHRVGSANARRLVAGALVIAMAVDAFGEAEPVRKWLRQPSKALGQRKPIDLFAAGEFQEVEDNLGRFIYGVYA